MSIQRTLQLWLLGGAALCTLVTGLLTYAVMHDEANELFDRQLRELVVTVPHEFSTSTLTVPDEESEDDIVVQVWNAAGKLVYITPKSMTLPRSTTLGYGKINVHNHLWRVYTRKHKGNFVQAAQPVETRDELAGQMALGATAPFLILIPVLLILIWFVIRRGLQPITQVTAAVSSRSMDSLQPIAVEHAPSEIRPLLDALNDLLSRLEKAWSAQRSFVADAAHELRSPLTALKLQLQRAEKTMNTEHRTIAFDKLHERLDRTVHVVQQLLTLARQEPQGDIVAKSDRIDLIEVATGCLAQLEPLAAAKQIRLKLDSPNRPIPIHIDPKSLQIMLENIIDNAIRYTPNKGHVSVIIDDNGASIILEVRDNGPGIPPDDRDRVFDRFYRREDSGELGSGLGLAIVKAIADRYRVAITLDATDDGGTLVAMEFTS